MVSQMAGVYPKVLNRTGETAAKNKSEQFSDKFTHGEREERNEHLLSQIMHLSLTILDVLDNKNCWSISSANKR
jgi:hypothetical protein